MLFDSKYEVFIDTLTEKGSPHPRQKGVKGPSVAETTSAGRQSAARFDIKEAQRPSLSPKEGVD